MNNYDKRSKKTFRLSGRISFGNFSVCIWSFWNFAVFFHRIFKCDLNVDFSSSTLFCKVTQFFIKCDEKSSTLMAFDSHFVKGVPWTFSMRVPSNDILITANHCSMLCINGVNVFTALLMAHSYSNHKWSLDSDLLSAYVFSFVWSWF